MLKKPNLTPEKGKAVAYCNQFPSNFLKPYGRAAETPTPETINKRTNSISCEWFIHPKVAMSEFGATLVENLSLLKDHSSPLLRRSKFVELLPSTPSIPSPRTMQQPNTSKPLCTTCMTKTTASKAS